MWRRKTRWTTPTPGLGSSSTATSRKVTRRPEGDGPLPPAVVLLRGDEAVLIQVVFAEVLQQLAPRQPFGQRDLLVLVRVELLEPRRQALGRGVRAAAAKLADQERKEAGPEAALARRDDAVGPGLGGLVDDPRRPAHAAAVVLGQRWVASCRPDAPLSPVHHPHP